MYHTIQELPFTHDLSAYLNGSYTATIYTNSLKLKISSLRTL